MLALAASLVGLLIVFDAGYAQSMARDKEIMSSAFTSQLQALLPSIGIGFAAGLLPATKWKRYSKLLWMVTMVLVIAVEYIGVTQNGAQRWLKLGITFQPAEIAKVATIVYLAGVLATRKQWVTKKYPDIWAWLDNVPARKAKRLLPALWVLVVFVFVEKEPDLGTASVIVATAFALFMLGGVSWKSLGVGVGLALALAWGLMLKEPYRMERFTSHGDRWETKNVEDVGFQTVQSEAAMASGHFLGVGFGNGRAKHILPAATTDFVMATVAEETGFLGSFIVIALIGAIVWRLHFLARQAEDKFCYLVIMGFAWWLTIQACVNVMMANAFLPAIGIPLPFVSSGGSSLLALWMAVGACQACVAPKRETVEEEKEAAVAIDRDRWRNGRTRLSGA